MFGLFKNKISHKGVVNQYDNSDLIKAYNLIKESVPEYKEPNYALAEKVFQDFNSFQLKLTREQAGPHLLPNLIPMSLLPYPKKYIKAAYYLYIDLANQKAPDMVRNIQELGFFLFSSYPNYEKYIDRLGTVRKVDEPGVAIIQEIFEKLFGTKEISREEYFLGAGSQECSDEKIKYDFGCLPDIEEDINLGEEPEDTGENQQSESKNNETTLSQDKGVKPNRTGRFSAYAKTMKRDEAIDVYKMWLLHIRYYHPKLDALFLGVSIPTFFLPVPMELLQETPGIIKEFKDDDFVWNEQLMDEHLEKYASRYYPRTGDDEEIMRGLADALRDQGSLKDVLVKIRENKEDWYFEYKEL